MGYKQINNPCDLIVFRNGTLNLFECKAIHGNTLNFNSHIRENQWNKLLEYSSISSVNAGILIWFVDLDLTLFIEIDWLDYLRKRGYKSFNAKKDLDAIPTSKIQGIKKKVFFDYDLEQFLEEISYE